MGLRFLYKSYSSRRCGEVLERGGNIGTFLVSKEFTFDAAHKLIHYHGKCERLHGHTYRLRVTVKGERDEEGMVIDFAMLKDVVQKRVLDVLDHSYLNDILTQPSTENVAEWIWGQLEDVLKTPTYHLYEIALWETPTSFVIYRENKSSAEDGT